MEYMKLLFLLPGIYLFLITCWTLYLAVMSLSRRKEDLGPIVKANAYFLLFIAYPFDFILNVVIGTVLFLDIPREWIFTARLKRYHKHYTGTWRDTIATWICTNLLDPFDPKGDHC